jgi:hypothetical protein
MTRVTVLQEVRQMRFEELYERRQRRELTMAEASEMLGSTERNLSEDRRRKHALCQQCAHQTAASAAEI